MTNAETFLRLAEKENQSIPAKRLVEYKRKNKPDGNPRYWAIVDFSRHSKEKRFYLFDTKGEGMCRRYYSAHGRGSEGAADDGIADVFSNEQNSHASSLGIYLCLDKYDGIHGTSMRLAGLEATNSNALARDIVVHSANYVSDKFIKDTGRIGRSWGCFVVEEGVIEDVVDALKNGSYLIAWKNQTPAAAPEETHEEHAPAPANPAVPTASDPMNLGNKKQLLEKILSVFETGSMAGDYSNISIYRDGPGKIRQITYGRWQTTEYGNLKRLVKEYAAANGQFSQQLGQFADRIMATSLTDNEEFKNLLRRAGHEDPVMVKTQDAFFDSVYFNPAIKWAVEHGFKLPLSALVIYDSFIHSGGIRKELRSRFAETPPSSGGDEKAWTTAYVNVRHDWLKNHGNPDVRPSAYRTKCFKTEIERGNWDLSRLPINANGTNVS